MAADDNVQAFTDSGGVDISYRKWLPAAGDAKAIVQIAHGASEHSGRYARFAEYLTDRGYAVFADDHRGHGLTATVTGVGKAGEGGWSAMVEDLGELGTVAKRDVGDLPLVLFGHSMGSFLAQRFIQLHGDTLSGVVLSGTTGGMAAVADAVGLLETMPADDPAPIFGPLNASFEPARTPFDWLSRDEAEVDKYLADPMCGDNAPLTIGFVVGMVKGGLNTWTEAEERRIPADLPVLFITGERDPVGEDAKLVRELEQRYRDYGIKDVTALYYPDARHELLNETNRDAVMADVVGWLDRVVG